MTLLLLAGMPGIVMLLVYLVIIGIVLAVVYYVINRLFPEPFKSWATVIVVVIGAILLIWLLLTAVGQGREGLGL